MRDHILTQEEIDAQWDPHIARQLEVNGPIACALVSECAEHPVSETEESEVLS